MNDDREVQRSDQLTAVPLTPQRVRSVRFGRSPIGRRGLNEDEVADFLEHVAEEIARRDRSEASARDSAARARSALRDWSTERAGTHRAQGAGVGRPPPEVVNMMSQAQQSCDRYIKETETYCRRLAEQAEQHASSIIDEARLRATEAAERAGQDYRAGAGLGWSSDDEDMRRRLAWMRTFIEALDAVGSQLTATREALRYEVDKIDALAPDPRRS